MPDVNIILTRLIRLPAVVWEQTTGDIFILFLFLYPISSLSFPRWLYNLQSTTTFSENLLAWPLQGVAEPLTGFMDSDQQFSTWAMQTKSTEDNEMKALGQNVFSFNSFQYCLAGRLATSRLGAKICTTLSILNNFLYLTLWFCIAAQLSLITLFISAPAEVSRLYFSPAWGRELLRHYFSYSLQTRPNYH